MNNLNYERVNTTVTKKSKVIPIFFYESFSQISDLDYKILKEIAKKNTILNKIYAVEKINENPKIILEQQQNRKKIFDDKKTLEDKIIPIISIQDNLSYEPIYSSKQKTSLQYRDMNRFYPQYKSYEKRQFSWYDNFPRIGFSIPMYYKRH